MISLVNLDKDFKIKMICDDIHHKSSNIEYDILLEIIIHIVDKISHITKSTIFNFDGEKEVQSYHCMNIIDIELLFKVKSIDNFIIYNINYYDECSFILKGFFTINVK